MAIILKNSASSQKSSAPAPAETAVSSSDATSQPDSKPSTPVAKITKPAVATPAAAAPSAGGLGFIKRGQAAAQTLAQEEKKAEMRQAGNFQRFWVPKGGTGAITFLDGSVKDGILDIPYYHEHQVNMDGSWNNFFICTQDSEPCPVCEGGNNTSYVGIMTVIDHAEYVSKKDGLVHKDNIRVFVAKRDTIKLLLKYAIKRGGLRGCRFDVDRTGDKSPAVGSSFDFVEKLSDAELVAKYKGDGKVLDRSKPVDYDKYLAAQYMPAAALRKLGFGSTASPIGSADVAQEDYAF